MIVITAAELSSNPTKYFDLAKTEKVLIKHGETDTFYLTREERLQPDEDLANAVTAEELLVGIEEDIRALYKRKNSKWKYCFLPM